MIPEAILLAYVAARLVARGSWARVADVAAIAALGYVLGGAWMYAVAALYAVAVFAVPRGRLAGVAGLAAVVSLFGLYTLLTADDPATALLGFVLATLAPGVVLGLGMDVESSRALFRYAVVSGVATSLVGLGVATGNQLAVILGTMLELGVAPLHPWVPDIYGRAHPNALALFAALAKLGAVTALIRLVDLGEFAPLLYFLGGASMLIGNVSALGSRDARRVLAYSTVAQAGYAVFAAPLDPGVAFAIVLADGYGKLALFYAWGIGAPRWSSVVAAANLIGVPVTLGFWPKLALLLLAAGLSPIAAVYILANVALSVPFYMRVAMNAPVRNCAVPIAASVVIAALGAAIPTGLFSAVAQYLTHIRF